MVTSSCQNGGVAGAPAWPGTGAAVPGQFGQAAPVVQAPQVLVHPSSVRLTRPAGSVTSISLISRSKYGLADSAVSLIIIPPSFSLGPLAEKLVPPLQLVIIQ
jgi:hypothetical protein